MSQCASSFSPNLSARIGLATIRGVLGCENIVNPALGADIIHPNGTRRFSGGSPESITIKMGNGKQYGGVWGTHFCVCAARPEYVSFGMIQR